MVSLPNEIQRQYIKAAFQRFYKHFSYLELEDLVEYFSILGGIGKDIELDYNGDVLSMVESNFVQNFSKFQTLISPSYLLETPYRELLIAVARGDGKLYSALRKAKLCESVGDRLVQELVSLDVLRVEYSRETPLKLHPKHKLKKDQRSYRIQDKLRFKQPYFRFWFGFVAYFEKELFLGDGKRFLENFEQHYERLRSLIYEQLCDDLLVQHFENTTPIIHRGSYWNVYSEFDILAMTTDKKLILGECKYKERSICKNELTKLKMKAAESGIKVDIYVLFSKSGFSKELLGMKSDNLLLFDLSDFHFLIS
jgi:hypothetical protein